MDAVLEDATNKASIGKDGNKKLRKLRVLAFNFEMAALLHDVGHSPMSHTLEKFFEIAEDISGLLMKCVRNKTFARDLSELWYSTDKPGSHEVVSAIIVCDCFKDDLHELCKNRKYSIDLEFIVRCIIGMVYSDKSIAYVHYKNALIRLLNSRAIDMDKLDYIKRDSIVSGYDNISVDTQRLLNSLTAVSFKSGVQDSIMLAFGKSSISVVQNVVDCRNMLYTWVYGHHKVVYESKYLFPRAIEKIIDKVEADGGSRKALLNQYFSTNAIKERLCADDDIWYLFKEHQDIIEVAELLDRRRHRTALWKTRVEFDLLFPTENSQAVGKFNVTQMTNEVESWGATYEEFLAYIDAEYSADGKSNVAAFIVPKTKESYINANDVYIAINNDSYSYNYFRAIADNNRSDSRFSYVYIDKNALSELYKLELSKDKHEFTRKFVEYIKKYPKFVLQPDFK